MIAIACFVGLPVLMVAYIQIYKIQEDAIMNKFRTVISVIIMVLAGIVGFFASAALGSGLDGAILFSMVAGIGCIVYTIDNQAS